MGPENLNEGDEELRDKSTIVRGSKPDLTKWIDALLATIKTSNKNMLVQEMAEVLQLLSEHVRNLEYNAEMKRRKRMQQLTGDYDEFCKNEINFLKELEFCKKVLSRFIESHEILPNLKLKHKLHAKDLYNHIDKFVVNTKGRHILEKQTLLNFYLGQIMIRFTGICESEKVNDNLPLPLIQKTDGHITPPELPPPSTVITSKRPNKIEHIIRRQISTKQEQIKDNTQINEKKKPLKVSIENLNKDNIKTATAFVEEYCKINGQQPQYEVLGVVKTIWNTEHIYTCKVLKYTGEGRGMKRAIAKQRAAANLIKTITTKERRGKLDPELKPLSIDQLELAIMLMSEYLSFDEDLDTLAQEEYQRIPIYTPLINTTGNYIRCKALGLNAVGYGKTKDIAKRMSAKLILDKYREIKEQRKKDQKLKNGSKLDNVTDK